MRTMKRLSAFCLFLLILFTPMACSQESGILIGKIPGSKVQRVSPINLTNRVFNYVDSYVLCELTFSRIVSPSPREGYLLIETNPDSYRVMVLVSEKPYKKKIAKLKRGKRFRACGTVSVVSQGDGKPDIAIIVE